MKNYNPMPRHYEAVTRAHCDVVSDYPIAISSYERMKRCRGNMAKFARILADAGSHR